MSFSSNWESTSPVQKGTIVASSASSLAWRSASKLKYRASYEAYVRFCSHGHAPASWSACLKRFTSARLPMPRTR